MSFQPCSTMIRLCWLMLGLILSEAATPARSGGYSGPQKAIIVFGDSISDNGNYYKNPGLGNRTVPLTSMIVDGLSKRPLYWNGRFTNAPGNWNDLLAKQMYGATVYNYAYAGATACGSMVNGIPSLNDQVQIYINKQLNDRRFKKLLAAATRVPAVWIGLNDIMNTTINAPKELQDLPAGLAACLANATRTLLDSGENLVLVSNIPPLEKTPFVKSIGLDQVLGPLVAQVNLAIQQMTVELQKKYTNQTIIYWDSNKDISNTVQNFSELEFKYNNTESCLTVTPEYSVLRGDEPSAVCRKPNEYIFLDDLHPTSKSHQQVVDGIIMMLMKYGIAKPSDLAFAFQVTPAHTPPDTPSL